MKVLGTVRWSWLAAPDGLYSVNSAYLLPQENDLPLSDPVMSDIWSSFAPSNIKAFTWRLLLDRIASLENLLKRNIIDSPGAATCKMCQSNLESSFHLLFSCSFSVGVWQQCLSWLGLVLAPSTSVREHFTVFQSGYNNSQKRAVRAIWMAAAWSLWMARNDVIFREKSPDLEQILELIKRRSWQW